MLCREALEATAWDVFSAKPSRPAGPDRGGGRVETATKTVRRLALALSGSADDDATVNKWKDGGAARRETLQSRPGGFTTASTELRHPL